MSLANLASPAKWPALKFASTEAPKAMDSTTLTSNNNVASFLSLGLEVDAGALAPHFSDEGLAGDHRLHEARLHGLEICRIVAAVSMKEIQI